ncbi:acyl carrier protein [Glycomyces sp. NPDC048151]|uniref:acyl carrier protein n=1 Tax=Glycomyces sp. NPDC048151 TaxID=3364002 RepID=UPI003713BF95
MEKSEWSSEFEAILRAHLQGVDPTQEILPTDSLVAFGLDSLATVGLLVALEAHLGRAIPDELITPDAFKTPGGLWQMIDAAQSA